MLSLQFFGGCSLNSDGTPLAGPAVQRRRLALLALVASAKSQGVSRDKLTACFWPEEDREHARHFLADSLFTIRKAVGKDVLLSAGSDIRLNYDIVDTDVRQFEDAIARGDHLSAIALYQGPFLDGFFVSDAPDFDRWADSERERLAALYGKCVERVAQDHEARGEYKSAADWWKRLAEHAPYNARVALHTMRALSRAGDSAAALQHAAKYERLVRDDLELPPDAEVAALAAELRSGSPAGRNQPGLMAPAISSAATVGVTEGAPPESAAASLLEMESSGNSREPGKLWHRRRYAFALALLVVAGSAVALGALNVHPVARSASTGKREYQRAAISTNDGRIDVTARKEAEDLYHQARYITHSTMAEDRYPQALALYKKAVTRDPTFAKAYAGMADVYNYMNQPVRAKEAALEALSIDSTMAEAHNALAYVYAYYDHRWLAADSAVERATRLSPRFTLAHLRRAVINAALGRADIALASLEKASAIEPESWAVVYNRASVAAALGLPHEAIKHFEAALALEPERGAVRHELAWQYLGAGRKAEAVAVLRSVGATIDAAIAGGDTLEMKALIDRFENDSTALESCQAAMIYQALGNYDAAFRQLRRGVADNRFLPLQMRSPPYVWLKDDPRYGQLMSELGLQ